MSRAWATNGSTMLAPPDDSDVPAETAVHVRVVARADGAPVSLSVEGRDALIYWGHTH